MKIGIDISQLTYTNTGVANYLRHLIKELITSDTRNEYILFYSSFRGELKEDWLMHMQNTRVSIRKYPFPPTLLNILWNKLHIAPIELFIGNVDVFITSDWTEPPTRKAKKATFLYDLIVYRHPHESTDKIVRTQKNKLKWVGRETSAVFCISEATKKDAEELLHIPPQKLHVIYPGFTL